MGSPDFAVPSLKALNKSNNTIATVVSGPDKRRSRRGEPEPTPVKKCAVELGLNTIDVEDLKEAEFEEQLRKLNADLFVVVAFKILPASLLNIPSKGSVNLHASLLPKYRGAAPIHWAVMNGEEKTGCTVFFLDETVDTGKIIQKASTSIGPEETTGDVYNRLKNLGAELLVDSVDQIAAVNYNLIQQDDEKATPAPKLHRENTSINFEETSRQIHDKIRGLSPFPTAWCMYGQEKMNIYRSRIGPDLDLKPGEMKYQDDKLLVGTGEGTVELVEVQLPGRKKMSGREFANGYDLNIQLS